MNIRKHAEDLANRPYSEVAFRDRTTDDDYIYVAITPELEGCIAQGETLHEALENLNLFRVDYIQHLLENNLPVPDPAWTATRTAGDSFVLPIEDALESREDDSGLEIQANQRERLFDFQLKVENDAIQLDTLA